jgi:hypothetical protein
MAEPASSLSKDIENGFALFGISLTAIIFRATLLL